MATKTKTGFSVTCPHCRDADAIVSIDLNDLGAVTCGACSETFTPQQARDLAAAELAKWEAVCRWVEAVPK
jgi:hypothetical protein